MTIVEELQDLALNGWRFWLDDGRLRYRAPDTADTRPVLDALRARRDDIVAALSHDPRLTDIAPLSDGQRALWFLWRLAPESVAYNQSLPLRITDATHADPDRWRAACARLVERHPVLRTRYGARDGEPWQQVIDAPIDWREHSASDEASFTAAIREAHDRPFDLAAAAPVRFTWIARPGALPALIVTLHHIACDGWSLEIIRRELPVLAAGEDLAAPAPGSTYQDFVWWQRAMLGGEAGERLWQYWRGVLDPAPAPLALPTDHRRPAVIGYGGDARQRAIPQDVAAAVRAMAAREGATVYAVFLAAFAAVLARWTRQRDLAIGTPNAGRSRPEFNGTLGYFVDPLVMRLDVDLDGTFASLVARARDTAVGALAHADFPFPRLVERLRVPRDAGRTPIFDVTFNFLSRRLADRALAGAAHAGDVSTFDMSQADGKFDLTLTVIEDEQSMRLSVGYRTELFDTATIERFCDWMIDAVATGAREPATAARRLVGARPGDAAAWHGRRTEVAALVPLPQQIAARAAERHNRVAVVAADGTLTYAQLVAHAAAAAGALEPFVRDRRTVVATLTARTTAFARALTGAMHAGAAWMPLDPAYPDALIASMLRRAGAAAVLTDAAHADRARAFDLPIVNIDALEPSVSPPAPRPLRLDDLAYVMFTSGSTGEPKGVAVSHCALANYTASIVDDLDLRPDDRLGMISSIAADLGHTSVFPALAMGATLNLLPDAAASNPSAFASWLAAHPVDVLKIVPSHFLALADQPAGFGPLPSRAIVFGGESTPVELAARVAAAGCRVFNHYGPTETTIGVMTHAFRDGDVDTLATLPLSRVVANASVQLIDADLAPVPVGMPGEVVISGASLSDGYVNDEARTSERFVILPSGERAYRTGDIARPVAGGGLLLLGRDDAQVGLHGYRIELGQIEHAACAVPGVARAVALADAAGEHAAAIGVWAVPASGAALDPARLTAALAERLPRHMVPSRAFVVSSLPVTTNGKLDTRAMRQMLADTPAPDTTARAVGDRARDTTEWRLLTLWRQALKSPQLGLDDDFFAHGGHSLLAVRLAGRIADEFGVELPLHAFFTHRTVASLAAHLRGELGATRALTPIVRGGAAAPLICLPGAGGNILYFHDFAQALGGDRPIWGLDATRLEARSVGETAAAALAEVDAAIASGALAEPVALAGHSFGALVAFEMTRRLRAAGRVVHHLVVIDNPAPGIGDDPGAASRDDQGWLRHVATRIGKLYGLTLNLSEADASAPDSTDRLIAHLKDAGALPRDLRASQFRKYLELYKANARAATLYQPPAGATGPIDVPVLVCRAATDDPELQRPTPSAGDHGDTTLGWSARTTAPVAVVTVPGTHITMLNAPNAAALAAAVRAALDVPAPPASPEVIT